MAPEPTYHIHQIVDLEEIRENANRLYFDGRVDRSHRVDHLLIVEMPDEYVYVIENGYIGAIATWFSFVTPLVEECKHQYALTRVHYGCPDFSRNVPGVTNWNPHLAQGEPVTSGY